MFISRLFLMAFAVLPLVAAHANFASAKSYGDRYLPLPAQSTAGKLIAAPVSDGSMYLYGQPSSRIEQLVKQARISKKN